MIVPSRSNGVPVARNIQAETSAEANTEDISSRYTDRVGQRDHEDQERDRERPRRPSNSSQGTGNHRRR